MKANKKFWKPVHTYALIALAVLTMSYAGLRSYVMDELILSGKRITKVNTGTLTNSDTSLPTSQTVYNAIQAIQADTAKPALSGWLDVTAYGAVADGSFSGGTDNRAVIMDVLSRAVNGSVVYFPAGSFYISDSILWPTTKRVYLVSYADMYFQPGKSGFVISGSNRYHKFWFNGKILGRNQPSTTPDYTNLTSAGIWLKGEPNAVEIHVTYISGFEDAIRLGGDATGTATANGTQYNYIYFNRLFNNVRGIHISPRGGTTNGSGNYGNASYFYGGQITGRLGIVYTKTSPQLTGAKFNGDRFYNIGFENFSSKKMDTAVKLEYGVGQAFYGLRFETATILEKIYIATDVDGTGFYGCNYLETTWLKNPGNATVIEGPIFTSNGLLIAMGATGYPAASGSWHNQRLLLRGTKRSPSAATDLLVDCPNCDIEWTTSNFETSTASSATLGYGITTHYANYNSGTATRTLRGATTVPSNSEVVIKNLSSTQSVVVVGAAAGAQTNIPPLAAITYRSDANNWYDIATVGIGGGGGGSSQWTTVGSNIYYTTGNVGIGISAPDFAWLHLGASTAAKALIEIGGSPVYVSTPRNNSIDYNGTDLRLTNSVGTPAKLLTESNFAVITGKEWRGIPITPIYIDGTAPAGYVFETDGTQGGAAWRENNGGFIKANLTTTSGTLATIATVTIPDNTAGEVEIKLVGYYAAGSTAGDMYKKVAVYNYVKKSGALALKGTETVISSYTTDFTPAATVGGSVAANVFTVKVASPVSAVSIKWSVYYKVRYTDNSL